MKVNICAKSKLFAGARQKEGPRQVIRLGKISIRIKIIGAKKPEPFSQKLNTRNFLYSAGNYSKRHQYIHKFWQKTDLNDRCHFSLREAEEFLLPVII